jgi:hypothetical protein
MDPQFVAHEVVDLVVQILDPLLARRRAVRGQRRQQEVENALDGFNLFLPKSAGWCCHSHVVSRRSSRRILTSRPPAKLRRALFLVFEPPHF